MSQKIIFFDIDGTILSHRTYLISKSTRAAIKQAKENGHLVFINTGRTYAELDEAILEVGFDGYVCGCGTYIRYHDDILFQTTIPQETCRMLIEDFHKFKIEAILEGASAIYYDSNTTYSKLIKLRDIQKNGHHFNVLTWEEPDISYDKFCIWTSSKEACDLFYEKYKERFDFIYRDGHLYEIVPKGYSKATGIEFLLTHLNIPLENAYALGDSANDLAMLNYVKHSIGMGNSEAVIKDTVAFLTKDVDDNGVAHALKHFNIIL
jgi:Cof subfamily protein (haloacid dehalogenase superfamily)